MPDKKTVFQDSWLLDSTLNWSERVKDNVFSCYCKICKKQFDLSNMGKSALISHMKGNKHTTALMNQNTSSKMNSFLTNNNADLNSTSKTQGSEDYNQKENLVTDGNLHLQQTVKEPKNKNPFVIKESVIKAEIIWCLNTVMTHISSSAKTLQVVKLMCPDYEVIQLMKLERTKIGYLTVFGLGPFFHENLKHEIKSSEIFSVAFDESLNKVSNKEQMDLMIRYWSDIENKAVCRYFDSSFLGHTTASELLKAIQNSIELFDLKRLLQISMDGPNVNKKVFNDFSKYLSELEPNQPELLDLGTCGLHTLHNAFKTGVKATGWNIVEFLRVIYNFFKNSPARKADFSYYTNSDLFPLKFCSVRWLNNELTASRAQELLPKIKVFIEEYTKDKNKNTSSDSFYKMASFITDKLIGPKLAFFQAIANEIEPFLTAYQTDHPMAPFLYTDLKVILTNLMEKFIKKDILEKNSLNEIEVMKCENTVGAKNLNLGYGTREALRKVKISDKEMLMFKQECLRFLQKMTSQILEKSPLKYKLARVITFCDPFIILTHKKTSLVRLKAFLELLVIKKRLSAINADKAEKQFQNIISQPIALEMMKNFSKKTERVDAFWCSVLSSCSTTDSDILFRCLKMIFVLFHGNASVERGFSVNKECLVENQKDASLVAQRRIWDAVQNAGGIEKITINKSMLHAARNARSKYVEFHEQKRNEESEKREQQIERKRKAAVLQELEAKKKRLLEEANLLDDQMKNIK